MIIDSFEKTIESLKEKLLELAREFCWNEISDNCVYILTEIRNDNNKNFLEQVAERKKVNERKVPKQFDKAVKELFEMYSLLYDINLYVFKAEKERTIVEIQYFLKSRLDKEFQETVKNKESMFHCKLPSPPYHHDKTEKFDINWHLHK